jgi:hypothetical protein
MWRMHNHPLSALPLFEREKDALSFGIHAVFGYRHVGAHLPLVWHWDESLGIGGKGARYFFSNLDLDRYGSDSLAPLGRFGEVRADEVKGWRPRLERHKATGADPDRGSAPEDPSPKATPVPQPTSPAPACPPGRSGYGGLCVQEIRDGRLIVTGEFAAGDTLLFREHAYPGWLYRVEDGPWTEALETSEQFLAVPLEGAARQVELAFVPGDLYRWMGAGAIATGLIAVFAVFRRGRKLSLDQPLTLG